MTRLKTGQPTAGVASRPRLPSPKAETLQKVLIVSPSTERAGQGASALIGSGFGFSIASSPDDVGRKLAEPGVNHVAIDGKGLGALDLMRILEAIREVQPGIIHDTRLMVFYNGTPSGIRERFEKYSIRMKG